MSFFNKKQLISYNIIVLQPGFDLFVGYHSVNHICPTPSTYGTA